MDHFPRGRVIAGLLIVLIGIGVMLYTRNRDSGPPMPPAVPATPAPKPNLPPTPQ